jgi:ABC-type branched-subunit amino acid transport system ATPase component
LYGECNTMQGENSEIIEVRALQKRFDTLTAVNDVSFSVTKGDIFGFVVFAQR